MSFNLLIANAIPLITKKIAKIMNSFMSVAKWAYNFRSTIPVALNEYASYVKRSILLEQPGSSASLAVVRLDGGGGYMPVPFKANGRQIDIYSQANGTYLVT